jgi:uncharacterized membrane protein YjjB (DUF3815 family)
MLSHLTFFNVFVAALGGACFGILFKIPTRYFLHSTVLAMIAKLGAGMLAERSHIGFATFVSAFVVCSISHLFARASGKPAQIFLIPGIMFLVPGSSIYKAFSGVMSGDFIIAQTLSAQAIVVTVSISFALLLANWIVPSRKLL